MQKIHQLDQRFLGLILASHVGKLFAFVADGVHPGAALAKAHRAHARTALFEHAHQKEDDQRVEGEGQDDADQHPQEGYAGLALAAEGNACGRQAIHQIGIVDRHGLIALNACGVIEPGQLVFGFKGKGDDVRADRHLIHLPLRYHLQEGGVFHLFRGAAQIRAGGQGGGDQQQAQQRNQHPEQGRTRHLGLFIAFLLVIFHASFLRWIRGCALPVADYKRLLKIVKRL